MATARNFSAAPSGSCGFLSGCHRSASRRYAFFTCPRPFPPPVSPPASRAQRRRDGVGCVSAGQQGRTWRVEASVETPRVL
eukprot:COSAG04_NODE_450_length_14158_cov_17.389573_9_plen_81_part_00